jgi:hypothetical protein
MSNATDKTEKTENCKALKLTMDKIDKDFGQGFSDDDEWKAQIWK